MNEKIWSFVDASGEWMSREYGMPGMTGRLMGWLLICEPPEQTAAQLADALDASRGSISGATSSLVRLGLVERLHVRGERADRFRVRPEAWDDQIRDQDAAGRARTLLALGLDALAEEPADRRRRLVELDVFYEWWQGRMDALWQEWQEYKRDNLGGGQHG